MIKGSIFKAKKYWPRSLLGAGTASVQTQLIESDYPQPSALSP
jgi:hypothetical protein